MELLNIFKKNGATLIGVVGASAQNRAALCDKLNDWFEKSNTASITENARFCEGLSENDLTIPDLERSIFSGVEDCVIVQGTRLLIAHYELFDFIIFIECESDSLLIETIAGHENYLAEAIEYYDKIVKVDTAENIEKYKNRAHIFLNKLVETNGIPCESENGEMRFKLICAAITGLVSEKIKNTRATSD